MKSRRVKTYLKSSAFHSLLSSTSGAAESTMNSKILPKVTMIKRYFPKRKEKSS
jgi:hypothetical protein